MEAAGIEPASRDTSMPASTCVVEGLDLVVVNVYRQDFHNNQPGAFLVHNVPDTVVDDPKLRLTLGRLRRAPRSQGCLIRQPVRDFHLHLKFLSAFYVAN